ncbi:MAG TPA: hypothetical protein VLB01_01395 [Thermodesulfobacteriota bacterium]|nr:hypothetical protein [Thermodesulfobacteriota bacterium]
MVMRTVYTVLTLFILSSFAFSSEIKFSVISRGYIVETADLKNVVIRSNKQLKKVWSELGIKNKIPSVDFSKELVVAVLSDGKKADSLEVLRVTGKEGDIEVRYALAPSTAAVKTQNSGVYPYVLAKLHAVSAGKAKVRFIQDIVRPPLPAGNAIGQMPAYTNMLKEHENLVVSRFLPLDKGNFWTYRIESGGKVREETYSVVSVSDGWSILDNFFGRKSIALRVEPSGDIFVSSDGGMQDFYTPEIPKVFQESDFLTPAGKFNDLMIVSDTMPNGFWFKDVYAREVGLVYHEHKSPKGNAKFTLVKAKVRGRSYPNK